MKVANVARVLAVAGACFAAVGSATSNTTATPPADPNQAQFDAATGGGAANTPPQARQMDAQLAMGVWRSTFGAVKLEPDNQHGGLAAGSVQGAWMYQKQGQQVVGLFYGSLRGNVLQFHWQEPAQPPLVGEGFLVFDPQGRQYSGRWWSEHHDRVGDWNGWRDGMPRPGAQPPPQVDQGQGQPSMNGAYPQGQPYPQQGQQPYPQQGGYPQQGQPQQGYPQQGQPQPYPQQGQPQPYPQQGPAQQGYPPPSQPYPAQPAPQQQPAPQRGYY